MANNSLRQPGTSPPVANNTMGLLVGYENEQMQPSRGWKWSRMAWLELSVCRFRLDISVQFGVKHLQVPYIV